MTSSKVYVGNLGTEVDKEAIEQEFSKFGLIKDVWIARNPPGFAFVVYNDPRDAEEAVRVMDNKRLCSSRIKVELSHTNDSRRDDNRGGRGRGQQRSTRDRGHQIRTSTRDRSPPRFQLNRGPQYDEPQSHRSSRMSPRGPPTRGPPMRAPPPRATGQRRSEERFDRGTSYDDRGRYQDPLPPRDRYAYERSSRLENEYDGFRNNGYRGEPQQSRNGYDRYNDRYPDRYDDRYGPPQPPERYREAVPDRPPPRSMDRGPERFPERRSDRGMNSSSDRFVDRFPRRSSPPPRGPPKISRMPPRSPPPRRGGRSPISRNWGRSRSPLR